MTRPEQLVLVYGILLKDGALKRSLSTLRRVRCVMGAAAAEQRQCHQSVSFKVGLSSLLLYQVLRYDEGVPFVCNGAGRNVGYAWISILAAKSAPPEIIFVVLLLVVYGEGTIGRL